MPSAMPIDDDVDLDLLEFMRKQLSHPHGPDSLLTPPRARTGVLESAEFIKDNAIDVALSRDGIIAAADSIYNAMQRKAYSTATWSEHELHPNADDPAGTVDFIFTLDLLNFSFWSEYSPQERFAVEYGGKRWTGYMSLVAALRRALDEGIPITCPYFWVDPEICTDELLEHVFRSVTDEPIPLLPERIACLREAGEILCERHDGSFASMIADADESAAALVVAVANEFPCFRDEHVFEGRRVNIYKRAQILVADIWACFNASSYGTFSDIDSLTMFADYRVPEILHALDCLEYAPKLAAHIAARRPIPAGSAWEIQLRGCAIWAVEMIVRHIRRKWPADATINAVLVDFYLYDTAKDMESKGESRLPHHRTRSIWY